MVKFFCDVCETEIQKSERTAYKLPAKEEVCSECVKALGKAADLMKLPNFIGEIHKLHAIQWKKPKVK